MPALAVGDGIYIILLKRQCISASNAEKHGRCDWSLQITITIANPPVEPRPLTAQAISLIQAGFAVDSTPQVIIDGMLYFTWEQK
jgi:hypothetical protein